MGCTHITAEVPGVLDLRSDGSETPVMTTPLPASGATRDGVGSFFLGSGAQGAGDVTVENRATFIGLWAGWLIHPLNGEVHDEWGAVIGDNAAARNVSIGEKLSIMGWLNEMLRGFCCMPLFFFTPVTVDMTGEATRIKAAGSARDESITPAFPDPAPSGPAPDGKY